MHKFQRLKNAANLFSTISYLCSLIFVNLVKNALHEMGFVYIFEVVYLCTTHTICFSLLIQFSQCFAIMGFIRKVNNQVLEYKTKQLKAQIVFIWRFLVVYSYKI